MKKDDVKLIQSILSGDDSAFEVLIKKYQKQVHTHAWRNTGDFHTAEDITQEVFLQVYQKLNTLEDPTQFSRWLHAIVKNTCIAWYRKNQIQTELYQETNISDIQFDEYSRYVASEHHASTTQIQRDLVNRLIAKLKESDQEVITLHYFEEMTSSEIGSYLGISENTVKSRLHRARKQLKQYEYMIKDELDISFKTKQCPQPLEKGELFMSDEVKKQSDIETRLEEMQDQIIDTQNQMEAIMASLELSNENDIKAVEKALLRIPHHAEDFIRWGYGGAYCTASGKTSRRVAIWESKIGDFLSKVPDNEIVKLAKFFTNPVVVAILRQLMEGKKSIVDLAKGCRLSETEMESTVEMLIDGNLAIRTDDNQIEPKNDAIYYYLNFVGMTVVYLNHEEYHSENKPPQT